MIYECSCFKVECVCVCDVEPWRMFDSDYPIHSRVLVHGKRWTSNRCTLYGIEFKAIKYLLCWSKLLRVSHPMRIWCHSTYKVLIISGNKLLPHFCHIKDHHLKCNDKLPQTAFTKKRNSVLLILRLAVVLEMKEENAKNYSILAFV